MYVYDGLMSVLCTLSFKHCLSSGKRAAEMNALSGSVDQSMGSLNDDLYRSTLSHLVQPRPRLPPGCLIKRIMRVDDRFGKIFTYRDLWLRSARRIDNWRPVAVAVEVEVEDLTVTPHTSSQTRR